MHAHDREATVVFTSGSSGDPSAAVHTLGNHYYSALGSARNIPFGPGDRWLLSLPLYHIGGLAILFRAMYCGGAVVVPGQDDKIVDMITEFGVTHLSLVSTQLYRLLKESSLADAARGLKAILVGGSAVPDWLLSEGIHCGLPLHTTYGLSEMSSQVTTTGRGQLNREDMTSGRLLDYRQLKITGDGEILVKGKTLFKGYRKGDRVSLPVDEKGWFSTGDLGRFDAECNLKLLGRKDNMFISGGENIYPELVESALVSFEDVENAIVVAVDDAEFGQRPAAFIDMRTGYEGLSDDQWRTRLRPALPGFMMPIVFLNWPESEAGTGLKPSRRRLGALATELVNRKAST
jgi:O-succinylbenzoic acid--CoA ligase